MRQKHSMRPSPVKMRRRKPGLTSLKALSSKDHTYLPSVRMSLKLFASLIRRSHHAGDHEVLDLLKVALGRLGHGVGVALHQRLGDLLVAGGRHLDDLTHDPLVGA